jgi:hypothetical protein
MQLTRIETQVLERLRKYRSVPPTLRERLRLMLGWMLLLLLPCIALTLLLARWDIPGLSLVPIGIYLGAIAREISHQRRFVKWWPVNREITDWSQVEQLLGQEPVPITRAPATQTRKKFAVAIGLAAFALIFGLFVVTDQTLVYLYNPARQNPPDSVIVLSASWCPYCASLRRPQAIATAHLRSRVLAPYLDPPTATSLDLASRRVFDLPYSRHQTLYFPPQIRTMRVSTISWGRSE